MEVLAPRGRPAGRYVFREQIGSGAAATVWRADDTLLGRSVAVKVLRPDLASNQELRRRFHQGAVDAASLGHPGIVRVFDARAGRKTCYIVMELVDGEPLRRLIDRRGRLEPAEAIALILPVLAALEHGHGRGRVHGGLTPGNILVDDYGRPRLADFCLPRTSAATASPNAPGPSVPYTAPEVVAGEPPDAASDVYSAGAVLYELLTGRPPLPVAGEIPPPRALRPGIPRQIEDVVHKATALSPQRRFPSAEAMRAALERAGETVETPPDVPGPTSVSPAARADAPAGRVHPPSAFRSWMLLPLVLICVAAVVIAGGLVLGRLQVGGPLGVRPAHPAPSQPAPALTPVHLSAARSFDPVSDGGDGSEDPSGTGFAIDGDPATAWSTDHYTTAAFGNLKPGVGLWVGLDGGAGVRRVTISSPLPGWTFQLKPGPFGHPGRPITSDSGATTFTVGPGGTAVVNIPQTETPGILVWITELAPALDGYSAAISNVEVRA